MLPSPTYRKWYLFTSVYSIAYLVAHLYTLDISPLPWFDETYMLSIAEEFIETGLLFPKVAQVRQMDQELIYGPVYFAITGTAIKLFGTSIFTFRITTLIAGFLVIIASIRLLSIQVKSTKILCLFGIALSLDPFLNRSMHEGRMDLLALLFILIASYHFLQFAKKTTYIRIVWAALFSLLALLTTPRTGFFFTAWAVIWISWLIQSWKVFFKPAIICLAIVVIGYSIWIYYAFGGITYMMEYYGQYLMFTRLNEAKTSIMKQQYPLILLGILSFIVGLLRYKWVYLHTTTLIAMLSVVAFYTMVFDQGPYAVFVVPSYYLLIFHLVAIFKEKRLAS